MKYLAYLLIVFCVSIQIANAVEAEKTYDKASLCALKAQADNNDLGSALELGKILYQPVPFEYWKMGGEELVRINVNMDDAELYYKKAVQSHDQAIHDQAVFYLAMLTYDKTKGSEAGYLSNTGPVNEKFWQQAIYWAEQLNTIKSNESNFILAALYKYKEIDGDDSTKSDYYMAKAVDGKFPQALMEKGFSLGISNNDLKITKEVMAFIDEAVKTGDKQAIHIKASLILRWYTLKSNEDWGLTYKDALNIMRKNAETGYLPSIAALMDHDSEQKEKWKQLYEKLTFNKAVLWLNYRPLTEESGTILNHNRSESDKIKIYKSCK